jgi:hypothetical protein
MKILIHSVSDIQWFSDYSETKDEAVGRLLRGKTKLDIALKRIENQIKEIGP